MSQMRFEQIKRFLYIARPYSANNQQQGGKRWWYKLEPLACYRSIEKEINSVPRTKVLRLGKEGRKDLSGGGS
jgi:hypothetical protein